MTRRAVGVLRTRRLPGHRRRGSPERPRRARSCRSRPGWRTSPGWPERRSCRSPSWARAGSHFGSRVSLRIGEAVDPRPYGRAKSRRTCHDRRGPTAPAGTARGRRGPRPTGLVRDVRSRRPSTIGPGWRQPSLRATRATASEIAGGPTCAGPAPAPRRARRWCRARPGAWCRSRAAAGRACPWARCPRGRCAVRRRCWHRGRRCSRVCHRR